MKEGLGCLLAFTLGIVVLMYMAVRNILRVLFGVRNAARDFTNAARGFSHSGDEDAHKTDNARTSKPHRQERKGGKIFPKDEGRYVDFEEVK